MAGNARGMPVSRVDELFSEFAAMKTARRTRRSVCRWFKTVIIVAIAVIAATFVAVMRVRGDYQRMQNANHTENSVAFCEQNE
jgi:hypothetical protein